MHSIWNMPRRWWERAGYRKSRENGRSQDFFRGGEQFFKKNFQKYSKNFVKNFVNFFKICKKISKDFQKNSLEDCLNGFLSIFFKKFNKPSIQFFARLDEKRYLQESLEKIFKKIPKNVLRKLLKLNFLKNIFQ